MDLCRDAQSRRDLSAHRRLLASEASSSFTVIPIAAKWLLIGRWKAETIPIWSLRYFRFWVVKTLIRSAPMAQFGGPIYNLYLRLLGAKIGKNATVIQAKFMPVCTDLISIGDNTMVRKDSVIIGYKAQSNYILTGPIEIGDNAFVGEGGILDINTVMEDNTQLGHASSLHEGQRVPRGKHFHGSPGGGDDRRLLRRRAEGLHVAAPLDLLAGADRRRLRAGAAPDAPHLLDVPDALHAVRRRPLSSTT